MSVMNTFREEFQRPEDHQKRGSLDELIERLITDYPVLSPDEKQEIIHLVEMNPKWRCDLESSQRLDAFLQDARQLNDPDADEGNLAWVLSSLFELKRTTGKGSSGFDEAYIEGLRRYLDRVRESDNLRPELNRLENRLKELESLGNAGVHYSEVSGHPDPNSGSPESDHWSVAKRFFESVNLEKLAEHRSVRLVVRVGTAGLFIFLVLITTSLVRDHGFIRMAQLRSNDFEWTEVGISSRGDDPLWEAELRRRFRGAVRVARNGQRTVLGLFPSYDFRRLSLARDMLEETIQIQNRLEPSPGNAHLLLAKIDFLLGQTKASRHELERALDGFGEGSVRAQHYLDAFEAEFGFD
jgi:hypothetical protein